MVGLEKKGSRYWLQGMHLANIPPSSWKVNTLENVQEIAKVVSESLRAAKPHPISGHVAMFALPESVIFSATLAMPILTKQELEKALPFELAERLSINPDEYHIDFEVSQSSCNPVGKNDLLPPDKSVAEEKPGAKPSKSPASSKPTNQTIFAAATKKTLVDSIVELCQLCKLELGGIDIKPGAIVRSVVGTNDKKARIIIDMGVGGTGVSVAEGHDLTVTSTVPWGTHMIAEKITGPVPELKAKIAPVFDELVHVIKFFENRICPGVKIEGIIISGTGAGIPGIAELFKSETGLPVALAEPFKNVDTHRFPVPPELTHTFADAIGLAMREA